MNPEQNSYEVYIPQPGRQGQGNYRKIVLLAAATGVLIGLALVISLFTGKSTILVNVESNSISEITYRLVNQADPEKVTEVKKTEKHLELKLPNGEYELTVSQDEAKYFAVVDAGSSSTTITATPVLEKGRRFVGNLPKDCLHFLKSHLVSYDCNQSLGSLQAHIPANASTPTYATPYPYGSEDGIEGTARTKDGSVLLTYEALVAGHEEFAGGSAEKPSPHVAFTMSDGLAFKLENRTTLADLDAKEHYAIQPYREGFMAYNESFTQAFYYTSLKAKPVAVPIGNSTDVTLVPYALAAHGSSFAVAYAKGGNNSNLDSEVVYHTGDQVSHRSFKKKKFASIRPCGDKKLCGLHENTLEVYDATNEDEQPLYTIGNVQAIENSKDRLIVIRTTDVLGLDVDGRTGSIQYSFDAYEYCGIQPSGDTYLLCVMNKGGARSALYIEQQQVSDKIDQKVAALQQLPEVTAVSIYGGFITISPDAGKVEYREASDSFGYNPNTLKRANEQIAKKLDELAIDRKKYQIINTLD